MAEIKAFDGLLYVVDGWQTASMVPERYRMAWPTGLRESEYPDLVGAQCVPCGSGCFRLATGLLVALEHRGETKPSKKHTETEPVKRPRWAKSWIHGQWSRYTE